jgi:DNA-binding NarL/FixJ family response regulator
MQLLVLAQERWAAEGVAAVLARTGALPRVAELGTPLLVPWPDAVVALVTNPGIALSLLQRLPPALPLLLIGDDLAAVTHASTARGRALGLLRAQADDAQLQAAASALALGLSVRDSAQHGHTWPATAEAETLEPLTPRELEVLELLAKGLGNRDIATALGISGHTAKFHVAQILDKTGTATRTEAVRQALRLGLVGL